MGWLNRSMLILGIASILAFLTTTGFHVYWYFGCKHAFAAVLTLNAITLLLCAPAVVVFSLPLRRAKTFTHTQYVTKKMLGYIPPAVRILLCLFLVYAVVVVMVFFGSLRDIRQIGQRYYVFPGEGDRIEIQYDEFCASKRENACSSSALLMFLCLAATTFYVWIFPSMDTQHDTAPRTRTEPGAMPSMDVTLTEISHTMQPMQVAEI